MRTRQLLELWLGFMPAMRGRHIQRIGFGIVLRLQCRDLLQAKRCKLHELQRGNVFERQRLQQLRWLRRRNYLGGCGHELHGLRRRDLLRAKRFDELHELRRRQAGEQRRRQQL